MKVWFSRNRLSLAAFFVTLVVLGATAGSRLQKRSRDPHFIVQAHAWLKGRLHIQSWPRGADDPARFEEVELIDGSRVWGRRITTRGTFRIAGGKEVRQAQIKRTLSTTYHVAFPPFPTVLMLPQVALLGPHASDVITTILFAALVPAFFLAFLRRLREEGL